jgi:hypothetical protein
MMRVSRALSIPNELEEDIRFDALEIGQLLYLHLTDADYGLSEPALQALLAGSLTCDNYPLSLRVALDMENRGYQVTRWQSLLQLLVRVVEDDMSEQDALKINEDEDNTQVDSMSGKALADRLAYSLVNPNILEDFKESMDMAISGEDVVQPNRNF